VKPSESNRRLLAATGHDEHMLDPADLQSEAELDAVYDQRHKAK
jgi:hypothetical protein